MLAAVALRVVAESAKGRPASGIREKLPWGKLEGGVALPLRVGFQTEWLICPWPVSSRLRPGEKARKAPWIELSKRGLEQISKDIQGALAKKELFMYNQENMSSE